MSVLASEALGSSVTGVMTASGIGSSGSSSSSTLLPTVTRVDARVEVNPVSVVLAVSVVFVLAPITISSNTMILAAFYRYKRLRTASNFLLASLAVSDFGVGVFMPFGMHLELSGFSEDARVSTLCIVPYCIVIALCSVSVLVTVAIAVDRLTSLAQPLRYKNIITHSSVEKYIAVFWLYAIGVGFSPLIYARIMGLTQPHSGSCRFGTAVAEPVRVFLVVAVWAPSALVLLGCYMYVYLVARSHARAIYTVELSFRHQTQTLALPRYGQTLAVTVGAFFILWLPFQACMLTDIFWGTRIMTDWAIVWLGLPILAHSGANPWIYAFHHGEMRVAATKIAEDVVTRFGIHPSRYGCSPILRGSNGIMELAEANKSNDASHRPPVENCFAANNHRNCPDNLDKSNCRKEDSDVTDPNSGAEKNRRRFSGGSLTAGIIDENDIHDLTKMLSPEYAIDRNHLIDSNHNIERIKNFKYLLDPTFNKIRHLRRLNEKSRSRMKNFSIVGETKFISYENLLTDRSATAETSRINAMSDPALNGDDEKIVGDNYIRECFYGDEKSVRWENSNLASVSDPDIKSAIVNICESFGKGGDSRRVAAPPSRQDGRRGGYPNDLDDLGHDRNVVRQIVERRRVDNSKKSQKRNDRRSFFVNSKVDRHCDDSSIKQIVEGSTMNFKTRGTSIKVTINKLDDDMGIAKESRSTRTKRSSAIGKCVLRHSESISTIERPTPLRFLQPSKFADGLVVPRMHSEPPSPIEPLPDDRASEIGTAGGHLGASRTSYGGHFVNGLGTTEELCQAHDWSLLPIEPRDSIVPFVLLNIDDFERSSHVDPAQNVDRTRDKMADVADNVSFSVAADELAAALLASTEIRTDRRKSETIFNEHDSTRYNSRRPSDLRWTESSRSQEVLSNVDELKKSPSSYSVDEFDDRDSSSDLNDVTCLGSFVCPDALTSSLGESFFEAPSVPDSDVFTSLEDVENRDASENRDRPFSPRENGRSRNLAVVHTSVSSVCLEKRKIDGIVDYNQSKSSESVMNNHRALMRLESAIHRNGFRVRSPRDCIIVESGLRNKIRMAPLAIPTPMDICTPTFDVATEIKGAGGVGVRV